MNILKESALNADRYFVGHVVPAQTYMKVENTLPTSWSALNAGTTIILISKHLESNKISNNRLKLMPGESLAGNSLMLGV